MFSMHANAAAMSQFAMTENTAVSNGKCHLVKLEKTRDLSRNTQFYCSLKSKQ